MTSVKGVKRTNTTFAIASGINPVELIWFCQLSQPLPQPTEVLCSLLNLSCPFVEFSTDLTSFCWKKAPCISKGLEIFEILNTRWLLTWMRAVDLEVSSLERRMKQEPWGWDCCVVGTGWVEIHGWTPSTSNEEEPGGHFLGC